MLMLLVELVAERVKQDPVPVNLMGVLAMVRSLPHAGLSVTRDDVIASIL